MATRGAPEGWQTGGHGVSCLVMIGGLHLLLILLLIFVHIRGRQQKRRRPRRRRREAKFQHSRGRLLHPYSAPMSDILRDGDIQSNPGPVPAGREGRPDLRVGVFSTLGCPQPEVHGFASAENRSCEEGWSEGDSALLHNWHGQVPIWMHPPFRLLPEVVGHLQQHGGHVLVLCPEWADKFHG